MPSDLSVGLRERVVAAIEAGASRRAAVKRFGVGAASAIRWHERFQKEGRITLRAMGGDQRSQAIEAQAERVVALYEVRSELYSWKLRDALAADAVVTALALAHRGHLRHAHHPLPPPDPTLRAQPGGGRGCYQQPQLPSLVARLPSPTTLLNLVKQALRG